MQNFGKTDQLCHRGVQLEEHYVCHGAISYEIGRRYHWLFEQGFGPVCKVMGYKDQLCLQLFLLELKRYRQKLLKENSTTTIAHQQRPTMTFFSSITPHAANQSQVGLN